MEEPVKAVFPHAMFIEVIGSLPHRGKVTNWAGRGEHESTMACHDKLSDAVKL
jgi:hypothetical protein